MPPGRSQAPDLQLALLFAIEKAERKLTEALTMVLLQFHDLQPQLHPLCFLETLNQLFNLPFPSQM